MLHGRLSRKLGEWQSRQVTTAESLSTPYPMSPLTRPILPVNRLSLASTWPWSSTDTILPLLAEIVFGFTR